ncbi:MAG: extracellular solute-binding protein [Anaeromyxobacter sp.]
MRSLLSLTLVLSALAARPAAAAPEVVVWCAFRAQERAAFEKVVASYNARPEAKAQVRVVAVPFDAFSDKISAAVPRGKGPDIFIYPQDRLGGWVDTGNTVEPIDFYVTDEVRARFPAPALAALTYRGQLWGLPLNYKALALIYNRKLLPQPPRTTAELEALARKLTRKSAGRYAFAFPYGEPYYYAPLINGFEGGVLDAKGQATLDLPGNVKAFELLMRWKRAGWLPEEASPSLITSLMNEGKLAMAFSGPWMLSEIAPEVDVGVAPLPSLSEHGGKPMRPWVTVEGAYVSAGSANKEAAFDFISYLTDLEAARVMALQGRECPVNSQVWQDEAVGQDPVLSVFHRQGEVGVPMPNLAEMTLMWPRLTKAGGEILRGTRPKDALEKAQRGLVDDLAAFHRKK